MNSITAIKSVFIFFLISIFFFSCAKQDQFKSPFTDEERENSRINRPPKKIELDYTHLFPQKKNVKNNYFLTKNDSIDPKSKKYINVIETKNSNIKKMNHLPLAHGAKEVIIQGKHIVIDKTEDDQGLFQYLHNNITIHHLTFQVETLEIKSELKVPQSNITIKAKNLIFSDRGSIDITPISLKSPAKKFENGADGLHGPNFSIQVKNFESLINDKAIFISRGGNGQDAGEGQDGQHGNHMTNLGGGIVYIKRSITHCSRPNGPRDKMEKDEKKRFCHSPRIIHRGTEAWPKNGGHARAGGAPGLPGNGGSIQSTFKIDSDLLDLRGGKSGKMARKTYRGGNPGSPNPAIHKFISITRNLKGENISHRTHRSSRGKNAHSPKVMKEVGDSGLFKWQNKNHWISDGFLKSSLLYARDLYKNNNFIESYNVYNNIHSSCKIIKNKKIKLLYHEEICHEVIKQEQQLSSGLNYDGNRIGAISNLSYELKEDIYNSIVSTSLKKVYLTSLLLNSKLQNEQNINYIKILQDEIKINIRNNEHSFSSIMERFSIIENKIKTLQIAHNHFLSELSKQEYVDIPLFSEENINQEYIEKYKKMIKVLAIISYITPFQISPMTEIEINSIEDLYKGLMSNRPWQQTIKSIPSSFTPFYYLKSLNLESKWKTVLNGINFKEYFDTFTLNPKDHNLSPQEIYDRKSDYLKRMESFSNVIFKNISLFTKINLKTRVSKKEIELKLLEIEKKFPSLQLLIQELKILLAQKEEISNNLIDIFTEMAKITQGISKSILNYGKLSEGHIYIREGKNDIINKILKDIQQSSLEDLFYFKRILGRAYEYITLRPFINKNGSHNLLKKINQIIQNNNIDGIDNVMRKIEEEYNGSNSAIVKSIINYHRENQNRYNLGSLVIDLKDEQIFALNLGKTLYFDLSRKDIFDIGSDDINAIEDIRVNKVKATNLDFDIEGNPQIFADATIDIIYSGKSYIRKNGKFYPFEFGNTHPFQRSRWKTKVNLLTKEQEETVPSFDNSSLIYSLVDEEYLSLFSQIGGLTYLKLKLKTKNDTQTKILLRNASLEINFSYLNK